MCVAAMFDKIHLFIKLMLMSRFTFLSIYSSNPIASLCKFINKYQINIYIYMYICIYVYIYIYIYIYICVCVCVCVCV